MLKLDHLYKYDAIYLRGQRMKVNLHFMYLQNVFSKLNLHNPLINPFTLFPRVKLNTVRYRTFQHIRMMQLSPTVAYATAPAANVSNGRQ